MHGIEQKETIHQQLQADRWATFCVRSGTHGEHWLTCRPLRYDHVGAHADGG